MTLRIHHLSFERENELLFSGIHDELKPGDILQVRGDNGCGKSTLLRILAGYIQPETGDVLWQDKNIFKTLDTYTQQLGYLGHQNGIKPNLTVYENLKLSSALSGLKIKDDSVKAILRNLNLEHALDTQTIYLSAGQKRRLALARLQLSPARLWILDEPTTALDHSGQQLFADLLKQHVIHSGIAIIATHSDLRIDHPMKTLDLPKHGKLSHV